MTAPNFSLVLLAGTRAYVISTPLQRPRETGTQTVRRDATQGDGEVEAAHARTAAARKPDRTRAGGRTARAFQRQPFPFALRAANGYLYVSLRFEIKIVVVFFIYVCTYWGLPWYKLCFPIPHPAHPTTQRRRPGAGDTPARGAVGGGPGPSPPGALVDFGLVVVRLTHVDRS